jgi:arylsulfatase A-like enzyme
MPRPNIIIITTDQQRTDSLSCYGSTFTSTPNLDRMAAEGALLERAYCTNPVCTPSRVSIFTGQQVSRHGAWNVGMSASAKLPMISHRLGAHGYRTHYIGKTHFQAFGGTEEQTKETLKNWRERYKDWHGPYYGFESVEIALGHTTYGIVGHYGAWAENQLSPEEIDGFESIALAAKFGGEAHDWELPHRLHNSVWTAERTIEFLRKHDGEKPFLLGIGFQDPHHPHALPTDFEDRVDPKEVPLPAYEEGELKDKPPHFLEAREGKLEDSEIRGEFAMAGQGAGFDYREVSERDARLGRAYYHSMVRLIDREMGRILDCLRETGLEENTLIFFTSDHGELLGDHGLWMKGPFHYEQLIRVPTIIKWPAGFDGGRKANEMFSLADIVPTALSAAGIDPEDECDGVDALPMLRGEGPTRQDILVECIDDQNGLRLKTLVTENRKLTWYCGKDYGELYDLEKDPGEKQNLWEDAAYASERSALLGRMMEYLETLEPRSDRYAYA